MSKGKKPVGNVGFFRLTGDGKGVPIDQSLPEQKGAIELRMVEMFLRSHPPNSKAIFSNPRQNKESDFDFTVSTDHGDAFLELMEIAPLDGSGGSFDNVPASHNAQALAAAITKNILKKSRRYRVKRDLFLLIYLTHWAFALGRATIQFLRYNLRKQKHVFRAVFYLAPLDDETGYFEWLFPVPPRYLLNFRPEEHKEAVVTNFDYRKWQIARGGDSAHPDQGGPAPP